MNAGKKRAIISRTAFSPTVSAKNLSVPPMTCCTSEWRVIVALSGYHVWWLRVGGHAMADILTSWPILRVPVKTGLTTETIVFESLSSYIEVPFRCPACRKIHRWKQKDAWVDQRFNGQGLDPV